MSVSEEAILDALIQVEDPELMVNIVDLGLIYGVGIDEVDGRSNLHVLMTMTTPACPYAPQLIEDVKTVLGAMEEVGQVEVEVTLNPPWTPDRMTEEARDELGMF
jgi:metal-sulfur cluster biosynthetic enzyme